MAITYTTNIKHLRGAPNLDDLEKVITAVEFEIIGVDGEHTHNALGDLPLTLDKDNFTKFEDITEENVKAWVEASGVYSNLCSALKDFIGEMKVPTNVGMEKPWA